MTKFFFQKMSVSFQDLSGFRFNVKYMNDTTLEEISRSISREMNIPKDSISFLYCGKNWPKNSKISSLNLHDNSLVLVHINKEFKPPFGEENHDKSISDRINKIIDQKSNQQIKITQTQAKESEKIHQPPPQQQNKRQNNKQNKKNNKFAPYVPDNQQKYEKEEKTESIDPTKIVSKNSSNSNPPPNFPQLINEIVDMGFSESQARNALEKCKYNKEEAIDLILNNAASIVEDPLSDLPPKDKEELEKLAKKGNSLDALLSIYYDCGRNIEQLKSMIM